MGIKYIIFSLDTEDFITPEADEALLFWTEEFNKRGLKASFNLVGEKARVLLRRGRKRIIQSLKKHEVNFHSNYHSIHPTFPEYLREMEWQEGIKEVVKKEIDGIESLREIFDASPYAYMQPGNTISPRVIYAMVKMGIEIIEWGPTVGEKYTLPYEPYWFCGGFHLYGWDFFVENFMRNSFQYALKKWKEVRENREGIGREYIVIGTHPCDLVCKSFWDYTNFRYGKNPPPQEWRNAPLKSRNEIEESKEKIKRFLDILMEENWENLTYSSLRSLYQSNKSRWITLSSLHDLIQKNKSLIDGVRSPKDSYSPADLFGILIWALTHKQNLIPVRNLEGPTGKLETSKKEYSFTHDEFLIWVKEVGKEIERKKRIPNILKFKGIKCGPGEFLEGMGEMIRGKGKITIKPGRNLPVISEREPFSSFHYRGTWTIFPQNFEAPEIIELNKLQTWTMRQAVKK